MPKLPDAQNTPLRPDDELVKKLAEEAPVGVASSLPSSCKRTGLGRHFEGYELGLVTVGMVLSFALLALPRPSVPMTLPLPQVNHAEARRRAIEERALAARAEAEGLPFEVRAVGEALRHFGRSSARGDDTGHDQEDVRTRVKAVMEANQTPLLLRLRAVQTQYFFAALRQFEQDGRPNAELDELGGAFVAHAQRSGWFDGAGKLLPDEATIRVLFRVRWADLLGTRAVYPFSPSLNEWRIYYRFLLEHPERASSAADATDERAADTARLRVATALGAKDPDYPMDMAQGFLLYRLGDAGAAATAYRRQLGKFPTGPYALLAQNYLIYTLQSVSSE